MGSPSQASSRGRWKGRGKYSLHTFSIRRLLIYVQNISDGNFPADPLGLYIYGNWVKALYLLPKILGFSSSTSIVGISEFSFLEKHVKRPLWSLPYLQHTRTFYLRTEYQNLWVKVPGEARDKAMILPPYIQNLRESSFLERYATRPWYSLRTPTFAEIFDLRTEYQQSQCSCWPAKYFIYKVTGWRASTFGIPTYIGGLFTSFEQPQKTPPVAARMVKGYLCGGSWELQQHHVKSLTFSPSPRANTPIHMLCARFGARPITQTNRSESLPFSRAHWRIRLYIFSVCSLQGASTNTAIAAEKQ